MRFYLKKLGKDAGFNKISMEISKLVLKKSQ